MFTKKLHYHDKFDDISDIILNKAVLHAKDKKYRICEIEFYLKSKEHNDEYVHGHKDQLEF